MRPMRFRPLPLVILLHLAGCGGDDSVVGDSELDPDSNQPPAVPVNLTPPSGASEVSTSPALTWTGSDPDGDSLRYSVRLGTTPSPPLVRIDLAEPRYVPPPRQAGTDYWWRISATDPTGASTDGPLWTFHTGACDSVVGDLAMPPDITITTATNARIDGEATNVHRDLHQIVVWAKTDRWHIQPETGDFRQPIACDGSWTSVTNSWERVVALVVDDSYQPAATNDIHPAEEFGVLAWDERPEPSARSVEFSGWTWHVKAAEAFQAGPGPNWFSARETAVWVDADGLHLATEERDGRWFSAEVILSEATGYGTYSFEVGNRVDNLDFNLVFAGFLYDTLNQEIDFEFSRSLVGHGHNAQYVVQPWDVPENIERYTMPPVATSSHRLEWFPDRIAWTSWRGGLADESPDSLIYSWTYTGPWNPTPDNERFRFNLWFVNGSPPAEGERDEVLVRSFSFEPAP